MKRWALTQKTHCGNQKLNFKTKIAFCVKNTRVAYIIWKYTVLIVSDNDRKKVYAFVMSLLYFALWHLSCARVTLNDDDGVNGHDLIFIRIHLRATTAGERPPVDTPRIRLRTAHLENHATSLIIFFFFANSTTTRTRSPVGDRSYSSLSTRGRYAFRPRYAGTSGVTKIPQTPRHVRGGGNNNSGPLFKYY